MGWILFYIPKYNFSAEGWYQIDSVRIYHNAKSLNRKMLKFHKEEFGRQFWKLIVIIVI